MPNPPKRANFWKPIPGSGDDSWHNENQDNSGRLFHVSDCSFPEFSANISAPATSGWPNFDPSSNDPANNQTLDTFADFSLPWPASDRLWNSPGTPITEWSLSSNFIWRNGYSEDDTNVGVNSSLPHNESSNVPPSLTQDKVFQIWSQKSKQSVTDASPNPWDSNQQHLVATAEILTDSTETLNRDSTQQLEDNDKLSSTQEKQEPSAAETNRENNATVSRIAELVNDPGNWGKHPINQSVPWKTTPEDGDLHKSKPSTALLNSHQQHPESNVWTNEPPTGTNVWELHYEQIANRGSCWPVQGRETPVAVNASGGGSLQASASQQSSHQSAIPSTLPQADHESAFQLRPSASSHFGPPGGLFRRPIFGAGATGGSTNRLPEDSGELGLPSRAAWATISSSHLLNQEENSWAAATGRCVAPTAVPGPTPSSATAAAPSFFSSGCGSGLEEVDQHQEVNTGVSMAAYRNDLVRYFLQQGFRREDVEPVLAECNMDIDRSLAVLRMRSRNAVGGSGGPPRYPGGVGGPRRVPTSPTATGQFGHFPNTQSTSAAAAAVAPFGRGMPIQRPLVGNGANRIIAGGVGGNRMPSAAAASSGDSILGSSLSSLLGLPPPQQQENGFSPMLMRGRNYQWQPANAPPTNFAFISSIMELQRKRQDIQRQIQMFRNNPTMCSLPGGMALLNELSLQLHHVEHQISAREVAGTFASSSGPPLQPSVPAFWSNSEEARSNTSSLTQRLQDLRIGASACNSNNNAASSTSNNPPSPRSAFRTTTNGFRSPRHNSGTDGFPGNGGNLPSGWLLIRGVPPSMSRSTLESFLGSGLMTLHSLSTRGTFVARFVSPEAAVDVGFQLTANAPNSPPLFVTIIEERQAFDLIVEALNAASGVNPVSAVVAAAASGGASGGGGSGTN
ncbi:unnamed protein product [Taenia asiatica]|uniref:UBA domain-containing protein n=1 Tax=Taenia asiatica TaxID=60517 RepID=A0A0R3VUM8_TAEAS|nr:unnamed protein product [Taenia asiatica]